MNKKEQFAEIFDAIRQVADFRKFPISDGEIRPMCSRLLPYHGIELFRIIHAISTEREELGGRWFPSVFELEARVRQAKGLPPGAGALTEEKIREREAANVVSGQDPAKARVGAQVLLRALKERGVPVTSLDSDLKTGFENAPDIDYSKPLNADPLAALEDFGEEDPLAKLRDF